MTRNEFKSEFSSFRRSVRGIGEFDANGMLEKPRTRKFHSGSNSYMLMWSFSGGVTCININAQPRHSTAVLILTGFCKSNRARDRRYMLETARKIAGGFRAPIPH